LNEKIHRPYTRELTQNWLYIADESLIYILLGKKKIPVFCCCCWRKSSSLATRREKNNKKGNLLEQFIKLFDGSLHPAGQAYKYIRIYKYHVNMYTKVACNCITHMCGIRGAICDKMASDLISLVYRKLFDTTLLWEQLYNSLYKLYNMLPSNHLSCCAAGVEMSNFYRFFSLLFICCATFKLLLLL
jgi:hypothetical protein